MVEIHQFTCLDDNFGVLIHNAKTNQTISIDAPEADAVEAALNEKGWTLDEILVTHHHGDHVGGIPALKAKYKCKVTAPVATKLVEADVEINGGDTITAAGLDFAVIYTPGHTLDHVVYYCESAKILAAADTLFSLGCGRMFEGTAAQFWDSLDQLRQLPDDVSVFCGHEYTLSNAKFAISIDPDNEELQARVQEVEQLRADGKPTLPVLLGQEKRINPFLRADDPDIRANIGLTVASNAEVFGEIRKLKDNF